MKILKWIGLIVLVTVGLVAGMAAVGATLPVKHTATRSATLKAPPQQVWDVVAGPPNWQPEVTRYEELPSVGGRRQWIEYGRGGSKSTYQVVEENPPQKLVTRIADSQLPFGGTWTYEIAPAAEGGSTLTITENGEVYNPILRFIVRYERGYTATIDRYLRALQNKFSSSQT
jgi:uncharacterized protein YndB with AHSA1/START domain